jgi:hypothetical protein
VNHAQIKIFKAKIGQRLLARFDRIIAHVFVVPDLRGNPEVFASDAVFLINNRQRSASQDSTCTEQNLL